MTSPDNSQHLLVDPTVLGRLRVELDDDEGWLLFLQRFLAHLPVRVQKLRFGLLSGDHGMAMDAVLSLKISCQMVGAERLAGLAVDLQRRLESTVGQRDAVSVLPKLGRPCLAAITACAGQTAISLMLVADQADGTQENRGAKTDSCASHTE
ncbi:MAG TPA: Hpt domain-containing protein [Arthrobacter bacterium]|jgi:HPt (histidine-containing phosphotransfer) domain-containing protein|nr:Hpt domain-containing protein [Arthrobacter sp.]